MEHSFEHTSVLLQQAVDALVWDVNGFYVDGTFGRGGHSTQVMAKLGNEGELLAIDKDPEAVAYARQYFIDEPRFSIAHDSFAAMQKQVVLQGKMGDVAGVLLDLGVSSPQLDDAERGFSFMNDGPLDMRMDTSKGENAAQWIARANEQEIANVIYTYGEERFSRRMAKAIVQSRQQAAIETTGQLARIIADANPAWEKGKNPATRAFQGIRIYINKELEDLEQGLNQALEVLKPGGHLVVISFHSLEDRMVKQFIRKHVKGDEHLPAGIPFTQDMLNIRLKSLSKAIKADSDERQRNVRARSAVMRVAQKVA